MSFLRFFFVPKNLQKIPIFAHSEKDVSYLTFQISNNNFCGFYRLFSSIYRNAE